MAKHGARAQDEQERDERRRPSAKRARTPTPARRKLKRHRVARSALPRSAPPSPFGAPAWAERDCRHRRVRRHDSGRRVERQLQPPAREGCAALGESVEVGDREVSERAERLGQRVGAWQQRDSETERGLHHPKPHRGSHGREREQVRREGRPPEPSPKWYASSGAVASVAATVIATPSQRPSTTARASADSRRARGSGVGPRLRGPASSSAIRRNRAASGRRTIRIAATAANDSCHPVPRPRAG